MFQLLSVLASSKCDYANTVGYQYLYSEQTICLTGSYFIYSEKSAFTIKNDYQNYNVDKYNDYKMYFRADDESQQTEISGSFYKNTGVTIMPVPTTSGNVIFNDKLMKMVEVNVSDIPENDISVVNYLKVPSSFSIETTARARITLRELNYNKLHYICQEQEITPDKTYKFDSNAKIVQLIVYADKSSDAIVSFIPNHNIYVDDDSENSDKTYGPKIASMFQYNSLGNMKLYFLETDKAYKRIYEESLGHCDIIIKEKLPWLKIKEFNIPKGKTLCGYSGFVMGSKEKYTLKSSIINNSVIEYDIRQLINQKYITDKLQYTNSNIFIPRFLGLFSLKCENDNSKDCKFQMLGINADGEHVLQLIINPDNSEIELPVIKGGFFSSDLSPIYFWSPVEKRLQISPWKEKDFYFNGHETRGYMNESMITSAGRIRIYNKNLTKVKFTISEVKSAASDDELLIPSIVGSINVTSKSSFTAKEVNKKSDDPDDSQKDGKLSPGAIAGIVIAVIVVIAIVVVVLLWFLVFSKKNSDTKSENEADKDDSGSGVQA